MWEFLDAYDWELSSAKVSGEGTEFESRKCTIENLELESFWRRTTENSQVHERLVIVRLKVSEVRWLWAQMLSFSLTFWIVQLYDFKFHTYKAPGIRQEFLDFEPYFGGGGGGGEEWNVPFLQAFLS